MKTIRQRIDSIRSGIGEVENDLIDELLAGRTDRRTFLAHGSKLGLSLPLLGSIATLIGADGASSRARAATPKQGGTLKVAMVVPAGAINPVTIADEGGLTLLLQVGEFLCVTQPDFTVKPVLAESWSHNDEGNVWTFKIRKGVKFHNGKTMTADDVVSSINRLADPKNASNALSAFKGVLPEGGSKKVDDYTVEFHLDQAYGNFPYLVSSDNYNAIIIPAETAADFENNFIGTAPFKLEKYTAKVGASFVKNPDYWGKPAHLDRTEFMFYTDTQPQVLALQGGQVDVIAQLPVQGGQGVLNDPNLIVISEKSTGHEQVHMRCDVDAFKDKRVRQAVALTLNRKNIVKGLFRGKGIVGNDSPFTPAFPYTDPTVPQREQDLAKAKELLAAAGSPKISVTLTTEQYLEIPDYAVLIKNAASSVGINIDLHVESQDAYYGKAVFGSSDWLDSPMGITDYGHRAVPNVFLLAPLKSDGTWNAAHFKSPQYDSAVTDYVKALDLGGQKKTAGALQRILLDETPVLFAYFYDYLVVTKKNVGGLPPIANRLFLGEAYLT